MSKQQIQNLTLEGVRIVFRNFSGAEGKYNRKGARNFCILLPTDLAEDMAKVGWNVRWLEPRNEEEEPQAYIEAAVNFGGRPPRVVMITSRGKTKLGEDEVGILDWADITNVDVILRPYQWDVNGKTGGKAYVQSLFVTIQEDELEMKYIDVPDSASAGFDYEPDEDLD